LFKLFDAKVQNISYMSTVDMFTKAEVVVIAFCVEPRKYLNI